MKDFFSYVSTSTKKFAVYTQFKNEGHVINEWIEHYLKEGADHIFLVDNGSTDNYKIEPKFNNNVTLIYNDKKHAQVELGEKYLKEHIRGKFKWVLVVDLDEFLFTKNYPTIRDYINKMEIENPHITCITVPWTMFGSSGHEKQPKSVVDNFLYRDAIDTTFQEGRYAKSLFQSYYNFNVHIPSNVNKKKSTLNFIPNQKSMMIIPKNIKIQENELQLNHYAIQSKDFFRNVKMTRGDIYSEKNENARTLDYFKKYDKNEHFDNLLSTKRKKKSKIYLVMCRYKENLDYITQNPIIFDNFDKIIIYNKGYNDINIKDKKIEIIPSENLGNAEESYFRFIIDNYNLENVVVLFSSASFYKYKHDYKKMQFQFILDRLLLSQNSIVPVHLEKNKMKNFVIPTYKIFALNRYVSLTKSDFRPYSNWVENVLNTSYKDVHYYSLFGIFAIHSSHWKNRSIDFYKKIHNSLYVEHPEVGHYIERGIPYIFKLPNENLIYLKHNNIFKIHKNLEFFEISGKTKKKIKEIVKQFTGDENFSFSSLPSRTSNIIKKGNIFIKEIKNRKYNVYKREKYIATLLKDYKWFPSLLYFDDKNQILVFKNVGNPVDKNNLPDDFFYQFNNILSDLKKLNIQHNDIKMEEILIDNEKNIYLSDFGWASVNGNLNCGLNIWGCSNTKKPGGYHDDETFLSRNFPNNPKNFYRDKNRKVGSQSEIPTIKKESNNIIRVDGYQTFIINSINKNLIVKKKPFKFQYINECLYKLRKNENCKSIIDIGCSAGLVSILAYKNGFEKIYSLDHDPEYINVISQLKKLLNISNIHEKIFSFGDEIKEKVDIIFCGALIHWIFSLTANFRNFDKIIRYLLQYTEKFLMIEWVDKNDNAIKTLKHIDIRKEKTDEEYNTFNFEKSIKKYTNILSKKSIDGDTRILYILSKK